MARMAAKNEIARTITVAYTHGTSATITISDATNVPASGVGRMYDSTRWVLVKFAARSGTTLQTLSSAEHQYADVEATIGEHEFPIGSSFDLEQSADYAIELSADLATAEGDIDDLESEIAGAIHDNVSGEIAALTEKTAPIAADIVLIEDSAAANAKKKALVGNIRTAGKIWLSAAGGNPSATSGCALPSQVEQPTNKVNVVVGAFDAAADEYMEWTLAMPSDWDGSTITAVFYWLANSTSTNAVVWGLQGRAYGDDEALDQAMGTAQTVTDANKSTAYKLNVSGATAAITLAGTPAASELVQLRAYRDADNGADNLAVDALLVGVLVTFARL